MHLQVWRLQQSLPPSPWITATRVSHHVTVPSYKVNCVILEIISKYLTCVLAGGQCLQSSQLKNLLPDCIFQPASSLPKIQFLWNQEFFSLLGLNAEATPPTDLGGGKLQNLTYAIVSLHTYVNLTW